MGRLFLMLLPGRNCYGMRQYFFIVFLFILVPVTSQEVSNWMANGYVSNMQMFGLQSWKGDWMLDNLLHNRVNVKWYNNSNTINVAFELRNRFFAGESVESTPGYGQWLDSDAGYFDLSANIASGNSFVCNTRIDRFYIDFTQGKFQLRAGRQRINWGHCFTWNPNDLFNTHSFFDFDYVEKPGCDAIRLHYYPSNTSTLELAGKVDSADHVTLSALYRFNKWSYDVQLLAGLYNHEDIVLGAGWSGNIKNASFRGEISYFRDIQNFADTTGILVVSMGSEYAFANSLTLQMEVLCNQLKNREKEGFLMLLYQNVTAKRLSFNEWSFMLQASYSITPLLQVSLAAMAFPDIKGYFLGPSLAWSLSDNVEFSLYTQSFRGEFNKGVADNYHLGYLRLKWNF